MTSSRYAILVALLAFAAPAASAELKVKIGVLSDFSGPFADLGGEGSLLAAKMAAEDFMASHPDVKIDVISADHQNKPDVGSGIARRWFDEQDVDVIADVNNSGVALAVNIVAKDKDKVVLGSGPSTADLTGKYCSPNAIQWTYDTYALTQGAPRALVPKGGDKWFFITADIAGPISMERESTKVVNANKGKVLGQVRVPPNSSDFSSALLTAQSSGANVIAFANAGADTVNSIKQAVEFGLNRNGARLAAILVMLTEVKALGLQIGQGLVTTEAFYWDTNDGTRAWSRRFGERLKGRMPTQVHAGVYASTMHYLKAVLASKTKAGRQVVQKMESTPTDDDLFGKGVIRQDGRKIHDMFVFEVKKPAESSSDWDLLKQVAVIPGSEAFRPLSEGECPLVK